MRDAEGRRDGARVMDVAARAAGALAPRGGVAAVVEPQRDADDVVAVALEQRRHDRRVHPARHGDDHARVRGWLGDVEAVEGVSVVHRQRWGGTRGG